MELSEENGVCCQCGGIYGELQGQNLSRASGWTYSIRGISQWGCPLTAKEKTKSLVETMYGFKSGHSKKVIAAH